MLRKSVLLHLRIPFSLYLLPFFCFALAQATKINFINLLLSFIIIHLLFYPASNGYNSYFDKDEESIGGLKNPPPVSKELYFVSLLFDLVALALGLIIGWKFALMLLIIGLVSKAYSHPSIRLKKYPILGLLTVAFFQGCFTFWMSYIAIQETDFSELFKPVNLGPGLLCSLLLLGSYPMTQIYQHNEDGKRGDKTMSRLLGIKGTFIWTALIFTIGIAGFYFFLVSFYSIKLFFLLLVLLAPTLIFFLTWFYKVLKDEKAADFDSTMKLNMLSSTGFIAFFIALAVLKYL